MTDRKLSGLRGKIHVKHGFPFKGEHFKSSGPYVVLTPGNFHEEGGFKRNAEKDKCYAEPFPEDYLLKQGDVVVAMTEQTDGLLGSMALIPENGRFLHNQRLGLVTSLTSDVDVRFLYHLFKTKSVREQIRRSASGSKVKHTSPERIYDVQVQLPTPQEQTAIANLLTALDAKIELNNRINAELEEMAKLLYDYWFVQFDFPMTAAQAAALGKPHLTGHPYRASGGKMIYNETLKRDIPEGWTVGSLLDVATFTNGIACQKYPADGGATLRVIKIKEMRTGLTADSDIVTANVPSKVKIKNGDILFSWSASLEVMIWAGGEGALNQHIFKVTSETYPRSFCYFVLLDYLRHFRMMADLRKTTMGHITIDHLEQSQIAIPNDEVAGAFEVITKPIIDRMVKSHEENQELTQLRDWLLPMLMNGQVTVGTNER
jgi:type I restriction enzyme S subunit